MRSTERSAIMRAVKSRGNASTEVRMVSILRSARLSGWRRHLKIPGTPDFAFPVERVVVMVHGCFWHGCPQHYRAPSNNSEYWSAKDKFIGFGGVSSYGHVIADLFERLRELLPECRLPTR